MALRVFKPFEPKFDECESCVFFRTPVCRPECLECGCGEFFEAKTRHIEAGADPDSEYEAFLKERHDYE